jgi:hypothetical protein
MSKSRRKKKERQKARKDEMEKRKEEYEIRFIDEAVVLWVADVHGGIQI